MSTSNTKNKNQQKGFVAILIPIALILVVGAIAVAFLAGAVQVAQKSCGIVKIINVITLGTAGPVKEISNLCDRLGTLDNGAGTVECVGAGDYAIYMPAIREAVGKYPNVTQPQLIALLQHESAGWQKDAISFSGAVGLGQFTTSTAQEQMFKDVFINIYQPEGLDDKRLTDTEKEAFRTKHGPNSSQPDDRFNTDKSILAATQYIDYQLQKHNNSFEEAYINGYHGHINDAQLDEARRGWTAIKEIHDKLIANEDGKGCTEVSSSEPFDGDFIKASGFKRNYPNIAPANNRNIKNYFDTAFGDALSSAISEATTAGITITSYSSNDGEHATASRHFRGLAVDIVAIKNKQNICWQKSFINGKNNCDEELQEIMAKHGLINLCYPFSGYPRGDCNHFQLADATTVKSWVKYNPSGVWANFTKVNQQKKYTKTRSGKKYTYTISAQEARDNKLVILQSDLVGRNKTVDNIYINSDFLAKLRLVWNDPDCNKCFKINAGYRTQQDQRDAWDLGGCGTIPDLSNTEANDYTKRTKACSTGGRTAVPGYSMHEKGTAVDIEGSNGASCSSNNCDKKIGDTMKKHGIRVFKACDPELNTNQNGLYKNNQSGSDCWHFSTTGF